MDLSAYLVEKGHSPEKSAKTYLYNLYKGSDRVAEMNRYRTEREKQLTAEGHSDSVDQSWADSLDYFESNGHHEEPPSEQANEQANEQPVPDEKYSSDLEWVYHNIMNPDPSSDNAPSAGAWGLLQWARDNRKEYYRLYGPKVLKQETAEESSQVKGERKTVRERLDMFESHMLEYQKKTKLLEAGGVEPGAVTYELGKLLPKNTRTIILCQGR
jgi:hypothetical protein